MQTKSSPNSASNSNFSNDIKTIGILGAGKVGFVIAKLALKAGYEVYISGSGDHSKIQLTTKILAPGAIAATNKQVAINADIAILALPLSKYETIPKAQLNGKIVIDSMNHWQEVDGPRADTVPDGISSSEFIQQFLSKSEVVKAISHMGYHELLDYSKNEFQPNRKAIAIAGNNQKAVAITSKFINNLGFDPLVIGDLQKGIILEPGSLGFGVNSSKAKLQKLLSLQK